MRQSDSGRGRGGRGGLGRDRWRRPGLAVTFERREGLEPDRLRQRSHAERLEGALAGETDDVLGRQQRQRVGAGRRTPSCAR